MSSLAQALDYEEVLPEVPMLAFVRKDWFRLIPSANRRVNPQPKRRIKSNLPFNPICVGIFG